MTYSSPKKFVDQYQDINISTESSPERLILLLYDGILKFSSLAKSAIEEKDIKLKSHYTTKVLNIFNELRACLDFERGGGPAKNLDRLYSICISHLVEANSNMTTGPLDWIIRSMTQIRDAWEQAFFPRSEEHRDIPEEDVPKNGPEEYDDTQGISLDITG